MKKNFNTYTLLFLISIIIISCGKVKPSNKIVEKQVNLTSVYGVEAKGKFRLFYIPSDKNELVFEGSENLFTNLKITQDNHTLRIKEKRDVANSKYAFYNINIYSNNPIKQIRLKDSIELNTSGVLYLDSLQLHLFDDSKIIASVRSNFLEANLAQKSAANFRGYTNKAIFKTQDSTGIIAPYLVINEATINTQGVSYQEIFAENILQGTIGPATKLIYYGDPVRKIKINIKATVQHKDL